MTLRGCAGTIWLPEKTTAAATILPLRSENLACLAYLCILRCYSSPYCRLIEFFSGRLCEEPPTRSV